MFLLVFGSQCFGAAIGVRAGIPSLISYHVPFVQISLAGDIAKYIVFRERVAQRSDTAYYNLNAHCYCWAEKRG